MWESAAREAVRERISFYGRTVAYRPVLELHGWGELQDELIAGRAQGKADLAALVSDEVVDAIAITGEPRTVVDRMRSRFGSIIDRTGFGVAGLADADLAELLGALKAPTGSPP